MAAQTPSVRSSLNFPDVRNPIALVPFTTRIVHLCARLGSAINHHRAALLISETQNLQILWFKRDLRVHDRAALAAATERGAVLPLFWGNLSMRELVQATRLRRDRIRGLPAGEGRGWFGALSAFEGRRHWRCHFMQSGTTDINRLRIDNPVKQSQDQDPEGQFIRRWIPALERVPSQWYQTPRYQTPGHQTPNNLHHRQRP